MNSSEHLLVLMSIILGLGICELLVGARAAAVNRSLTNATRLPFLAGALVLIASVQFWWYLFIVAERGVWSGNFFLFAATLFRPMLLFLSGASVFPSPGSRDDIADHYFRNRGFIFLPLALFEAQNLIESSLNLGTLIHPAHLFHIVFTAGCVALAISSSEKIHKVLLMIGLLLAAVFIGVFSLRLD